MLLKHVSMQTANNLKIEVAEKQGAGNEMGS